MARRRRYCKTNVCTHVMLRGIEGRAIFRDDRDRSRFCLLLQEAAERHFLGVHAFCLMTNHIHLLLEPMREGEPLSAGVHRFSSRYAQYFNRRHGRGGYLFQGRFRSILVGSGEYMRRLVRYIHRNPVEAGIVVRPEAYYWSSHNSYLGRATFSWLEVDRVLQHFGSDRKSAMGAFVNYMYRDIEASADLEEIRKAARLGVFGDEEFSQTYGGKVRKLDAVPNVGSVEPVTADRLIGAVACQLGISLDQLRSAGKAQSTVDARAVIAHACRSLPGLSLSDIGRALGKNSGTLSRLAQRAESNEHLSSVASEVVSTLTPS